ncbi:MAG: 3-deoxy-7-phosphoheptulonate synthase [Myxococcota bacterium]
MLIVMRQDATRDEIRRVVERVETLGYSGRPLPGAQRTAVAITGNEGPVNPDLFASLGGVTDVVRVSAPYKLVSREVKPDPTVLRFDNGVQLGGPHFHVMAGPCSVENREQVLETARAVKEAGATFLRGGAYKPRTSPYAFQGLKEEGLELLAEAREETGLLVVTEVKDTETLPLVAQYTDVLQVGARNMQNYSLLEAAGRQPKPVMLKRGMSATIKELLMAAEYIVHAGNPRVILCERGIRTFETMTRNTFDVGAIHMLRHLSHLPVVGDPSHGIGLWHGVGALARAAVVAGAHGLIVEVHPRPADALSDGPQSLKPKRFARMMREIGALREALEGVDGET